MLRGIPLDNHQPPWPPLPRVGDVEPQEVSFPVPASAWDEWDEWLAFVDGKILMVLTL